MAREQQRAHGTEADCAGGRVIICGTGRAGTSFLVRLLTRCGIDTGFTREDDGFSDRLRAGCELRATGWDSPAAWAKLPRVVKSPFLSVHLAAVPVPIDCVLIPVRDLRDATDSRQRAGLLLPGVRPEELESKLAEWLGRAVADISGLAVCISGSDRVGGVFGGIRGAVGSVKKAADDGRFGRHVVQTFHRCGAVRPA